MTTYQTTEKIVGAPEGEAMNLLLIQLPETDEMEMMEFATSHRKMYHFGEEQDLFIGVPWVIPDDLCKFRQFPEVICVDTTGDTNQENRPLLTIMG